ncbi:glutamine--tRNA ligase [Buchnera aphidicola str. APS (Acyrthosiphon pisum)]|uniref:Glutamine--tRNA ligase n=1 Tax=Buchnera aphidicola subsp. Acyrthosiphon pisum (strain APS) TaxID=107806 RepID=SYQ_BUCAI|nr:glutamine--tRNA ligase [Buchnera aphidicola]P57490.1 RecName: Full=Glutamine--tRNA ligase; AltName: Full=Glutaminyl-tRNA synthetase; Short=GlnRS [Buchnera aphidicola str. APS (Acyrthosiphon pisum)]pir/A84978/ glutamine-tRNA ligase (EC 6.1.1.18) [imported] - Buchnera sp. (strain APS) [Buchnera sp. (in: enterobacteria)]BAB13113.1 glutaminyl-tRNA synthetase [Buchnera aphidicola str. APS (Acyrthosiphon pisum)]
MDTKKEIKNNNFICQIINKDLNENKNLSFYTRFPPEPNGYLHIGHAKSICLNFELASLYKGRCNLRFDDTNPLKENIKYIESIKHDINWLGYKWHGNVRYASEYFLKLYQYAQELIKKGLAYVDHLTKEQIREYRGTLNTPGKNSPYRNRTIQENIELFEKMKKGDFSEGEACLRAKINMSSSSIIMRDPVLYRIIFIKHHQTQNKWCIYPMYDFAHCLSDSIEGITHSLCTLEFQDNKFLYNWILKNTSVKHYPKQYEFSRLNLEFSILSKRKIKILIDKNIIEGWDDPRIPTLSALRRKGYTPSSIKNFCQKIGVTKQNNLIEFSMLEHCIRKELNQTAIRTMAILDPIKIFLYNLDSNYKEEFIVPNHPNNPEMGTHKIIFTNTIYIDRSDFKEKYDKKYKRLKLGEKIRLRYSYIIHAEKIEKDEYGNISNIICYCDLNTLGRKPKDNKNPAVIHWISEKNTLSAEFKLYDQLFNIKNPEQQENFLLYINSKSLIKKFGFIEKKIGEEIQKKISNNNIEIFFQFERIGYFCIDFIDSKKNQLVFNRTVGLRDTWDSKKIKTKNITNN